MDRFAVTSIGAIVGFFVATLRGQTCPDCTCSPALSCFGDASAAPSSSGFESFGATCGVVIAAVAFGFWARAWNLRSWFGVAPGSVTAAVVPASSAPLAIKGKGKGVIGSGSSN